MNYFGFSSCPNLLVIFEGGLCELFFILPAACIWGRLVFEGGFYSREYVITLLRCIVSFLENDAKEDDGSPYMYVQP